MIPRYSKCSLLFLFVLLISGSLKAAVGITAPSLTINTCSFPSVYNALGNIVIDEGANGDFPIAAVNTDYTFVITAPANFQFQALTGTITNTGAGDITTLSMVVAAGTITVTYRSSDGNRTNEDDFFTISGIQVRAITGAAIQTATKTASSEVIAGLANGSVMANLTSTLISAPAITGQPANAAATTCTNTTFTAIASGAGLTYQWQEFNGAVWSNLANGGVYSNVTTATLTLTNPGIGLNTYQYRCVVSGTCTPSATTNGNATLTVTVCAPAYCTSNATSTADEEILNVTFGTLNNNSTCATTGGAGSILNQYSNYTAVAAPNVTQGATIPFSIQIGTCGGNFGNAVKIFIDYNQDADFADAGEEVYVSAASTSGPHFEVGNIVIPAGAALGNTRMRVVNVETGTPSSITACGTYTWGETEDYTINIVASGPMVYASCTTTQTLTSSVQRCGLDQQIIGIQVVTTGSSAPLSLTQIQMNMNGSTIPGTNTNDVTNIQVFYTGTSSAFSPIGAFNGAGSAVAAGTIIINGSQTLTTGTNYFWIAYDLNPTGTIGNVVDAQCTRITVAASNYVPTVTSPAGSRAISVCNPSPGGVSTGLETWIRADVGVTGVTPITAWTNQNTTGTATLINGSPNLNNTATTYNYNPYVDFTGPVGTLDGGVAANRQCVLLSGYSGIAGVDYRSLFFMFQLDDLARLNTHCATVQGVTFSSPANGTWHGDANGATASILLEAYDITDFGTGAAANTWQRNAVNVPSNSNHSSTKHILSAVCQTGGSTTLNAFLGGQSDQIPASSFAGHVRDWRGPAAEVIGYSTAVSALERQRINSYLAIKYGTTLAQNYLSTSGSTIFTTAAPYNNNIIGIGRDDIEVLYQKQSHNDDDIVRIYVSTLAPTNAANTGTFTNDISYVVSGATTGAMCATVASVAEMPIGLTNCLLYSRIEREWKVTRTNMAQNFNMDFRLAPCGIPGSVAVSDLRVLVDDDGNFANGGTQCYYNGDGTGIVISYSNPTITVTGFNTGHIPNSATKYITIASIQAVTPLPVELTQFDAKLNDKRTVDLTWTTESEMNSDYFVVQRSLDTENWEDIASVDAAGNSNSTLHYADVDYSPFIGINYYRLKQFDFDGAFQYSETRAVDLTASDAISVFPNPTADEFFLQGKDISVKEIHVFNSIGQEIQVNRIKLSDDILQLDGSGLSNGIYTIQVQAPSETFNLRLIKVQD